MSVYVSMFWLLNVFFYRPVDFSDSKFWRGCVAFEIFGSRFRVKLHLRLWEIRETLNPLTLNRDMLLGWAYKS